MAQERDAQFVEAITKLLVENPDSVEVNRTIDDLGVLITLRVHPDDMATIIGREGRSAKSIRTLLRIIGAKEDQRVNLKIVEPEGSERAESPTVSEPAAPVQETPTEVPTEEVAAVEEPAEEEQSQEASDIMSDIPEPLV